MLGVLVPSSLPYPWTCLSFRMGNGSNSRLVMAVSYNIIRLTLLLCLCVSVFASGDDDETFEPESTRSRGDEVRGGDEALGGAPDDPTVAVWI